MRRLWRASMACQQWLEPVTLLRVSKMVSGSASTGDAVSLLSLGSIAWFADIGLGDRQRVGGKGGSLGELQRAGIAVPPGFVVKTGAFERFLQALERKAPVRSVVESLKDVDLAEATARCAQVRARVEAEELPPDVLDEISAAHAALCGGGEGAHIPVAVRSSATTED